MDKKVARLWEITLPYRYSDCGLWWVDYKIKTFDNNPITIQSEDGGNYNLGGGDYIFRASVKSKTYKSALKKYNELLTHYDTSLKYPIVLASHFQPKQK